MPSITTPLASDCYLGCLTTAEIWSQKQALGVDKYFLFYLRHNFQDSNAFINTPFLGVDPNSVTFSRTKLGTRLQVDKSYPWFRCDTI